MKFLLCKPSTLFWVGVPIGLGIVALQTPAVWVIVAVVVALGIMKWNRSYSNQKV